MFLHASSQSQESCAAAANSHSLLINCSQEDTQAGTTSEFMSVRVRHTVVAAFHVAIYNIARKDLLLTDIHCAQMLQFNLRFSALTNIDAFSSLLKTLLYLSY